MSYAECTEVSPQCPVSATTYGYAPNLAGNIIFLVVFALCTIAQFVLGLRYRLRAFAAVVTLGCAGELIGYVGRIIQHYNAWSQAGFKIQIVCLILSPSFLAAGIYLSLKHVVLHLGPEYSKLKPHLYTWIFIGCDIFSILLQAAGGGIAAAETADLVNIGDDVMIVGIAFQVGTLALCGVLAVDFGLRVYRNRNNADETRHEPSSKGPKAFKLFLGAMILSYFTIFIRSIYRVPELAGGWGNPRMQNEPEFLVLDGAMVAIAAIAMTVAYPGVYFPAINSSYTEKMAAQVSDDENNLYGQEECK